MEIAKLFATAGVNVDLKGLDVFESRLLKAQEKVDAFVVTLSTIGKHSREAKEGFTELNTAMGAFKGASAPIMAVARAIKKLDNNLSMTKGDANKFVNAMTTVFDLSDKGRPKIHRAANAWDRFSDSLDRAILKVKEFKTAQTGFPTGLTMRDMRVPEMKSLNITKDNPSASPSIGKHNQSMHSDLSRLATPLVGSHIGHLFGGGLATGVGAIYSLKELADKGQEAITAANFVRMGSDNEQDYQKNKERIWNMAQKYGIDINNANESWGKFFPALSKRVGKDAAWKGFEQQAQFFTSMHTSNAEQKQISKALYQMAGAAKVMGTDYNQWQNYVPNAEAVSGRAAQILGIDLKGKTLRDSLKNLNISGSKLVPALLQAMQEQATKNGALDVGMHSYQANKGRFQNRLTRMSENFMEGGGGKMLGDMFSVAEKLLGPLEKLLNLIIEVYKSIKSIIGVISELYNWFSKLNEKLVPTDSLLGRIRSNFDAIAALLGSKLIKIFVETIAVVAAMNAVVIAAKWAWMALNSVMKANPYTKLIMILFTLAEVVKSVYDGIVEGWYDTGERTTKTNWVTGLVDTFWIVYNNIYIIFMKLEMQWDNMITGFMLKLLKFTNYIPVVGDAVAKAVNQYGQDKLPNSSNQPSDYSQNYPSTVGGWMSNLLFGGKMSTEELLLGLPDHLYDWAKNKSTNTNPSTSYNNGFIPSAYTNSTNLNLNILMNGNKVGAWKRPDGQYEIDLSSVQSK